LVVSEIARLNNMTGFVLITGQRVPPFAMPRTVNETAAGTPAPGKIGARRLVSPCGRAPPAQRLHLRAPHFTASLRRSVSGSGPFGTTVPCRVHRQHRVPVWVRAGPSTRRFRRVALVVAPLL